MVTVEESVAMPPGGWPSTVYDAIRPGSSWSIRLFVPSFSCSATPPERGALQAELVVDGASGDFPN